MNIFDHPIVRFIIEQREQALNNACALAGRVGELEQQVAKLQAELASK